MPVEPTPDQLAEIQAIAGPEDGPLVMLNPNRYRDPEILEVRAGRLEGLERAALLRCEAAAEPVLGAPEAGAPETTG